MYARRQEDGVILVENSTELPEFAGSIAGRLDHWATQTPDAPFLSQGDRVITYAEVERRRRHLSARLLSLDLSPERPLMIIGENSIEHALVMLAATRIARTVAIVSPNYVASNAAPWTKFGRVESQVDPSLIFADDPAVVNDVLATIGRSVPVASLRELQWLDAIDPAPEAATDAAEAAVTLDTVAKLLFTSGSTGSPKAVINTQRMMVSNMVALSMVWPFLESTPPVMVDWLPWNHTFGGNCCFNLALWFGGHLHIDDGRPVASLVQRTAAAIRRIKPTVYFNVPIGYELLLPLLEADRDFAATFLGGLDFLFNAGAAMPPVLRQRLEAVARASTGRSVPIAGGWGSTETAPFSTALSFPTPHDGNLGVPIPGTTIKMVPSSGRYELRVRGPNVTPGYWRDPELTAAAFDEEGFYLIGDAGRLADENDPEAGILFDGRVSENFKLLSGTFVNVGGIRLAAISAGQKLISDVVVAGENRHAIGILIFPNEEACRELIGTDACAALDGKSAASHPTVAERLKGLLRAYNASAGGSSLRIARFMIADEPLQAGEDEVTDKGYINQRRVLTRRAAVIDHLFNHGIEP